MNRLLFFSILLLGFFSCQESNSTESELSILDEIVQSLDGEFDNFQQTWQENTEEGLHKIEVDKAHQHIHTRFDFLALKETDDPIFIVTHSKGRDSAVILKREVYHFWEERKSVFSMIYELPRGQEIINSIEGLDNVVAKMVWEKRDDQIIGSSELGNIEISIHDDIFSIQQDGLFDHDSEPYRMLKCRFFSGWIEYPLPDIPDSTYFMRNLKIHDQGGIVPLVLEDGTVTDYSVELTQLVYGKRISIMKLAIYEEPFDSIHYNSRAVSYAWADPKAKRLGLNIRKIVSGWTLIEPGYINSNNMDEE